MHFSILGFRNDSKCEVEVVKADTINIKRNLSIDKERDVRICDRQTVVKVRFQDKKIRDILVNDIFVWPRGLTSDRTTTSKE